MSRNLQRELSSRLQAHELRTYHESCVVVCHLIAQMILRTPAPCRLSIFPTTEPPSIIRSILELLSFELGGTKFNIITKFTDFHLTKNTLQHFQSIIEKIDKKSNVSNIYFDYFWKKIYEPESLLLYPNDFSKLLTQIASVFVNPKYLHSRSTHFIIIVSRLFF